LNQPPLNQNEAAMIPKILYMAIQTLIFSQFTTI